MIMDLSHSERLFGSVWWVAVLLVSFWGLGFFSTRWVGFRVPHSV